MAVYFPIKQHKSESLSKTSEFKKILGDRKDANQKLNNDNETKKN